jgi:tRNA A-37 threonylcarbamoyl transferase component Bud32/Tfp pilus assembly protein PilF
MPERHRSILVCIALAAALLVVAVVPPVYAEDAALTLDEAASLLGLPEPSEEEPQVDETSPETEVDPLAEWRKKPEVEPLPEVAEAEPEPPAEATGLPDDIQNVGSALALLREHPDWIGSELGRGFDDLGAGRFSVQGRIAVAAAVPIASILLLLIVRMIRGRGDLVVEFEYPSELQGRFLVRLSQKKTESARPRIVNQAEAEKAKSRAAGSSLEHHMVSRETQFRRVPVGTWFVSVDGFIQQGEEIISTRFEEREIHIERRGTPKVALDLSPRACPVEVKVSWDRRPVPEAQVARFNAPSSVRLAKGPVTYPLAQGRHILIAGSADRVAEVPVEVSSFHPFAVEIDLANRETLLFNGCPPAVAPYLAGDIATASRELERDGQSEISNLLLARFHQEQGQNEAAARHFESAGNHAQAAELREAMGQHERAGELYERCGDDERAAEMFRAAGLLLRAGDAYSRASSYDSAVSCFEHAGDVGRWVDALAKKGEVFEAASVALDQGDRSRAIQYLSEVGPTHERYPDAARRLAEAYRSEGHCDLAARKLEELQATRGEDTSLETLDLLAQLHEEAGEHDRALDTLEKIRERDATFENLAARIERIRHARSNARAEGSSAATLPGGFGSEGRYEIQGELGRGGMGIVFKAKDKRLGRIVALKRLPDNLRNHPKAVELFLREARAAAALNHPNIVTLFDADQQDGAYYITMELLEGSPLQRILRSRERLSPVNVAKLGGQIATGLHYAHGRGVVHRDIKTANLFFTRDKVMKIMDFGLAKMQEEVRRATTVIGGTPYYMAPEQSAGKSVDHRADLYALGVTFYELLTGSVPFKEGDVAYHHRHTPPPDPRQVVDDLPDDFATLILQCMEKLPGDRPADAQEVCARLSEIARQF